MGKEAQLYTKEVVVFRKGVEEADLSQPISVVVDSVGNHGLQDGNHRAKKAEMTGQTLKRTVIGTSSIDISQDPDYRLVSELKIIEG